MFVSEISILLFFIGLFFAHWIGDFVLQPDWMALNKSKSLECLLAHVGFYGVPITIYMLFADLIFGPTSGFLVTFVWINIVLHGMMDFVTSRASARLPHNEQWRHRLFCIVGFDQFCHHAMFLYTFVALLHWSVF